MNIEVDIPLVNNAINSIQFLIEGEGVGIRLFYGCLYETDSSLEYIRGLIEKALGASTDDNSISVTYLTEDSVLGVSVGPNDSASLILDGVRYETERKYLEQFMEATNGI